MFAVLYQDNKPHAYLADALREHGDILVIQGNTSGACEAYKKSLAMMQKLYGSNKTHYKIATLLEKLRSLK